MEVEMSRRLLMRIGLALVVLMVAAGPTLAAQLRFTAVLKGANERPTPVDTNAAGVAKFTISPDDSSITYRLIVANIDGVTQAHIHCGTPDVAGPVVVFLYGFNATGVTVNGILAEGTITEANVIPRPDSAACPGGVATLADVIAKMRSGGAYANVHTLTWPAGEIRGPIN
jgi:CHRD domain-containing protein